MTARKCLPAEMTDAMLNAAYEGRGSIDSSYRAVYAAAPGLTDTDIDRMARAIWPDEYPGPELAERWGKSYRARCRDAIAALEVGDG